MKIVFIGAVEFSRRALLKLIEIRADVSGVCTLAESPANADHVDLRGVCESHGIPWRHTPRINDPDAVAWIRGCSPDVIYCFGWSRLLGEALLTAAPLGVIGFHPAALPANRGRHPIVWALALGLPSTASTFFFMDSGADSGDILSQSRVVIRDYDTAAMLYDRISDTAVGQIAEFTPRLRSGTYLRVRQDPSRANSWRKRGRSDGQIDWRMSARSIYNLVRALTRPYVGAHLMFGDTEIKVWSAEIVTGAAANIEPGKVLSSCDRGVLVRCGEDAIRLLETEPAFHPEPGTYL